MPILVVVDDIHLLLYIHTFLGYNVQRGFEHRAGGDQTIIRRIPNRNISSITWVPSRAVESAKQGPCDVGTLLRRYRCLLLSLEPAFQSYLGFVNSQNHQQNSENKRGASDWPPTWSRLIALRELNLRDKALATLLQRSWSSKLGRWLFVDYYK